MGAEAERDFFNNYTTDQFNRVKGAMLSQYENSVRTNSYWHNNIRLYKLLGNDLITEHRSAIENLTLEDFNVFMRALYDGGNRIQVKNHHLEGFQVHYCHCMNIVTC